jgi:hypothetical protein
MGGLSLAAYPSDNPPSKRHMPFISIKNIRVIKKELSHIQVLKVMQ